MMCPARPRPLSSTLLAPPLYPPKTSLQSMSAGERKGAEKWCGKHGLLHGAEGALAWDEGSAETPTLVWAGSDRKAWPVALRIVSLGT